MKLNVKVKLLGVFRGLVGKDQLLLRLQRQRATVGEVIRAAAEMLPNEIRVALVDHGLGDSQLNALVLVNGREIGVLNGLETVVSDADEIALVPIAHGG